jgi:hypothetical protein
MLVRLAAQANGGGYLGGEGSRMYGHSLACLALANALGATRDDDLDERLRLTLTRGIAVTVTAARVAKPADQRGGWHYEPDSGASDLSVTGWQLASLYAARRAGLPSPMSAAASTPTAGSATSNAARTAAPCAVSRCSPSTSNPALAIRCATASSRACAPSP